MVLFFQAMTLPFLACLLLAGIHVYLGIHVIARKVIFVDLALAQIAALGAVYGILLGFDPVADYWPIKGFSLLFALLGAVVFSLTRMRHEKVPHEAIIGITYAVALSATILASAHLPHGADEVRELLAGNILWVDATLIWRTALLYGVIGIFHFMFRRQFLLISLNHEEAERQGLNIRLWDFLFYFSFGFVVTSSVSIAGVLLVFCYLVIPAVVAILLGERLMVRLAIGWTVGAGVSFFGVVLSYVGDLPSGPTIVVCFAAFLLAVAVIRAVAKSARPLRNSLMTLLAFGVLAGGFYGSTLLKKPESFSIEHLLVSKNSNERELGIKLVKQDAALLQEHKKALETLAKDSADSVRFEALKALLSVMDIATLPLYHAALLDANDEIRELAIRGIRQLPMPASLTVLHAAIEKEHDDYLRVELAETLLELGERRGLGLLIEMMDEGETEQVRKDAHEHFAAHTFVDFAFGAAGTKAQRGEQMAIFRRWWQSHEQKLRYDARSKRFMLE